MHQTTYESVAKVGLRKAFLLLLAAALTFSTIVLPASSGEQEAYAAQGDTLVVAIDPGHGGSDPGALGDGFYEKTVNWAIALACANELSTYSGVKVVLTRGEDENVELVERVQRATAEGADVVVSIHCNSVGGAPSANGAETYVPTNSSNYLNDATRAPGYALGSKIQAGLVALGFSDRGVKIKDSTTTKYPDGSTADYFSIIYNSRLAGIPGLIVEHGFVTNANDAAKLNNATWQMKIGISDATAIAEYYGLSKVPSNGSSVASGDVQKVGEAVVTKPDYQTDPTIMGVTALSTAEDADVRKSESVAKMVSWWNSKNKTYPEIYASHGAATIENFCAILYDEAVAEGVRPEVAFAQSMKETGWLQFKGQVNVGQCNFCGLGALDGDAAGADFSSYVDENGGNIGVRIGLRAQMQHLRAYADKDATESSLNNPCVDPRFGDVNPKGKATTVGGLSGTWASDTGYGERLTAMINELLGFKNTVDAVSVSLKDVEGVVANGQVEVYVNGVATTMTVSADGAMGTVPLLGSKPQSIVMYDFKNAGSTDKFQQYPTGMHTWLVREEGNGYAVQRYYGLEDLMIYSGCSIRVTGNKGIRMITGMSANVKDALAGSDINGYTLVETGTLLAWSSGVDAEGPTLETSGVSRGRAYIKGSTDPVLYEQNGIEYYTNVLVGDFSAAHCKASLAMRPYVILADSDGNQFAIYGGVVHRSIGYIAEQNANAFPQGTAAYNYVHSIIDACK